MSKKKDNIETKGTVDQAAEQIARIFVAILDDEAQKHAQKAQNQPNKARDS
jgi:hypothetical protein